jgi:hypothetical protein
MASAALAVGLWAWLALVGDLTVVVLGTPAGAPGDAALVEAVRIQLAGIGRVEAGPVIDGADPEARRAQAEAALEMSRAALVIWVEGGGAGENRVRVFVLGEAGGDMVLEERAVEARAGPERDRALALKVREIVAARRAAEAQAARAAEAAAAAAAAAPAPPAAAPGPAPAPARRRPARWRLEGGGRGALAPDELGLALGAGAEIPLRSVSVLALVRLGLGSGTSERAEDGAQVATREAWAQAAIGWLAPLRPVPAELRLGLGLRRVVAEGTTAQGAQGELVRAIPEVELGAAVGWPRERRWQLRAAAAVGVSPLRQRFAVNEQDVLDLGRLRGLFELGLAIFLP